MQIRIAASPTELGRLAAQDIACDLRATLAAQAAVRMVFAAAPSQAPTLAALLDEPGIDWSRVVAFHMDEYVGLPAASTARFSLWLRRAFFDRISAVAFHAITPDEDSAAECLRYAALLEVAPIDLVLCGIGENGHLAFNDPPALLDDPETAKVVWLDHACRQQQVNDGCFATLAEVPTQAVTLTVPTLLAGRRLYCSVPGERKRNAVARMLHDPVSGHCPATALRYHSRCTVYLDQDSSASGELPEPRHFPEVGL